MKQSEFKPCAMCGKGMTHTGMPLFWRVSITRFGVDLKAVQRRHGLELMVGSPVLAGVMGANEDLAKPLGETINLLICEECALKSQPIAALAEQGEEIAARAGEQMSKYAKPYDRSCTGKQRLMQADAERIAGSMRIYHDEPRYHAYGCELCGAWHVGRAPKEEKTEAGKGSR